MLLREKTFINPLTHLPFKIIYQIKYAFNDKDLFRKKFWRTIEFSSKRILTKLDKYSLAPKLLSFYHFLSVTPPLTCNIFYSATRSHMYICLLFHVFYELPANRLRKEIPAVYADSPHYTSVGDSSTSLELAPFLWLQFEFVNTFEKVSPCYLSFESLISHTPFI